MHLEGKTTKAQTGRTPRRTAEEHHDCKTVDKNKIVRHTSNKIALNQNCS